MDTSWKLMSENAITDEQRALMGAFLVKNSKLTQGKWIKAFEEEFADWNDSKYAVFVNSGSSANLILLDVVKEMYGNGPVVCQGNTWATNVSPVVQLGMNLQLVDCDSPQFYRPSLDELKRINQRTPIKYLFLTHILGYPALTTDILNFCNDNDIIILEDCCESHGAEFRGHKVGTIGLAGTFSFYYGHHMTTVEGGMITTDDEELYKLLLLKRSHGMISSLTDYGYSSEEEIIDPRFTFLKHGYNVRGQEVNAYLGTLQLPNLDDHIKIRNRNYGHFNSLLSNKYYLPSWDIDCKFSNYAFPIICKTGNINKVKETLNKYKIEHRPLIAGNLFQHPFMKDVNQYRVDTNLQFIHENALYVGNHQHISLMQAENLAGILDHEC